MNTRKLISMFSLAAALGVTALDSGCGTAAFSGQSQAALDAASQSALGAVINNNPNDFNQFVAAYPLLYTLPAGQVSSYQLGQTLAAAKISSKGAADLTNTLDGIIRNLIAQQSGGTGVTSVPQAIAEQVLGVVADGYWHALNNFAGLHGLPPVPQYSPAAAAAKSPGT